MSFIGKPSNFAALETMSTGQLAELISTAKTMLRERQVDAEAERRTRKDRSCPHCGGDEIVRWGVNRGLQRWRCNDCRKTFTGLTSTPLQHIKRRDLVFAVIQDMMSIYPLSCRKAAEELGVHHMTVWRWRRKVMEALENYGDKAFKGIIEADETFVRESRKGSREWVNYSKGLCKPPPRPQWYVFRFQGMLMKRGLSRWQIPVLVLRDRAGATRAEQLPGLSYKHIAPVLDQHLPEDVVLCSDSASSYRKYAKQSGIRLEQMNVRKGEYVKDGTFHIQNANALHQRFKDFMYPFKGPATKYLRGYVGWMVFRDTHKGGDKASRQLLRHAFATDLGAIFPAMLSFAFRYGCHLPASC